jgi:tRNA modification GTPase
MPILEDTIVALSTAAGQAAISVLRVSGPQAFQIARQVFHHPQTELPQLKPRYAHRVQARSPEGDTLDDGLALLFHGPHSYTGENIVEFQGHGGILVTQKVLQSLLAAGARLAEPGEFTHRAFLNGKMDLTQAEAVMDLIHAQSTLALKAANEQLSGLIGQEAAALKEDLLAVLAHVEAYIDFPEEDISPDTGAALCQRLETVLARTQQLLASSDRGRILRHGARTVICGEPNVGKSSLLNLLLGFERAIVSQTAGTTRDTIEEIIQVQGIPLRLVDTAGLRDETQDEIEKIGIQRTHQELQRADLILEVVDASHDPTTAQRVQLPAGSESRHLLLLNKTDLGSHPQWPQEAIPISCLATSGIAALTQAIHDRFIQTGTLLGDHLLAINTRHQHCFERVAQHTSTAAASLRQGIAVELIALDLREALLALGEVIGTVDVEEILDVIFSSFCLGK